MPVDSTHRGAAGTIGLIESKCYWLQHPDADTVTVTADQLEWLLDGYDVWKMKKHRTVRFTHTEVFKYLFRRAIYFAPR